MMCIWKVVLLYVLIVAMTVPGLFTSPVKLNHQIQTSPIRRQRDVMQVGHKHS